MERLLGLAPTNQAKANQHTVTQKQFFRRWRFSSLSLFFFFCLYYYSALLCHIVEGKHTFQNQASAAASVQNRCSKPKPKPSNCCLLEQQRLWSQKLNTNTEIENKISCVSNVAIGRLGQQDLLSYNPIKLSYKVELFGLSLAQQ